MLLSAQFTHTKLNTHHSVSQQGHEGFSYRSATITEGRRSVMECHRIETSGSAWRVDAPPDGGGAGRIKLIFYPIWKMDFQKAARRSLLRQYNELCKWSVIRGIARIVLDPYLSVRHPNPTPSRCVVQFECKRTIQWRAALAVSFGQFIRWLHNYSFMNLLPLFIFYSNNGIAIIISRTIDKRND